MVHSGEYLAGVKFHAPVGIGAIVLQNLLSPPVLFFFLGILARVLGSDLEVPAPLPKFLSMYLLMAIGFKGGVELGAVGLERLSEWWRRSTAPERGPTTEEILLADAQRYSERVGAEPMDSAPLAQRFTQPSVQPELVRQLVPRRKALILARGTSFAPGSRLLPQGRVIYRGGEVDVPEQARLT